MRVTTAFNHLLDLQGVWVKDVVFEPQAVVVGVALRRRWLRCPRCDAVRPGGDRATPGQGQGRRLRWRGVRRGHAWENHTGLTISYNTQLQFNVRLANMAHQIGLTVGLKNDLEQVPDLFPYFDFAINEQCQQYSEC